MATLEAVREPANIEELLQVPTLDARVPDPFPVHLLPPSREEAAKAPAVADTLAASNEDPFADQLIDVDESNDIGLDAAAEDERADSLEAAMVSCVLDWSFSFLTPKM